MEYLQSLLDTTQTPVIYAFILGLMTAISPCPLATNITAVAYISKEIEQKNKVFINGFIYTLGRAVTYITIGLLLFAGASKFEISNLFIAKVEKIVGPLLIIIGIFMLDLITINFPSFNSLSEKFMKKKWQNSGFNAFFLGMIFALAFCPYSGVLFFGMLIPITIASSSGLYLPLFFAIATGLPVIIIAYFVAYSISGIGNFYKKVQIFQKWFNRFVAAVFIVVGIYYVFIYYF